MDERIKKARAAQTPAELLALAKEEGVELTEERANAYFEKYHPPIGELSDEEIANVTGGGCAGSTPQAPDFHKGDRVMVNGATLCKEAYSRYNCASAFWIVDQVIYDDSRREWLISCICPGCGLRYDWSKPPYPFHRV